MDKAVKKEKQKKHVWNYKNLLFLFAGLVFTVVILTSSLVRTLIESMGNYGYLGAFIIGIFFAFLFTAAPATAAFLLLAGNLNPILIGLIGGLGAMLSDALLFSYIRYKLDPDIKYIIKKSGIMKIKELEKTKLDRKSVV